jgi:hypothetical protein
MVAQLRAGLIVVASTLMMALVVTDTAVVGGIVVVPATEESTGSMGEHTQAVRYQVVVARLLQVVALVEQLQVAGVYGKRLIRVAPNDVTMEDIVGPRRSTIRLAGEGAEDASGLRGPRAADGGGGEGAEVAAVGALGLEYHEVLVHAIDGVHLHGLE